jgi:hypothetical protein
MPSWDDVVAIGERLPGVQAGSWWGTPGLLRGELGDLIEDAWRLTAPDRIVAGHDQQ